VTAAEAGAPAVILDHVWVGAGIHIHTGGSAGAREPLLPWDEELPADPNAVLALLAWQTRLAPLAGRDTAKLSLLDWARQGRRKRIRLLSGPGGVGKSRLAAEVAEALRKEGWTAGFINPKEPIVVPLRRAGLFLIVDDPEEDPEATQNCCERSRHLSSEMSRCGWSWSAGKPGIDGSISSRRDMPAALSMRKRSV
jgi:hypothetical protein